MRKIAIGVLICFWGVVTCYGQLSPAQVKLLQEYKKQQELQPNDEIERFSAPEIYSANPDKAALSKDVSGRENPFEDNQLRLFGHDIFEDTDSRFVLNIYDLPPDGYTFGPGDNIIVNVWGRVDLELNLTVDREGKVFIPKVGEIVALGSTLEQFKENLNNKLSKIYSDFQFSVSYGKLRQISIYVFGEVNSPNGYTVSSTANLLHALYTAGGITNKGSLRNIQLVRNTRVVSHYDLYDLLLKGDNSKSIKLMSGDVVYVPVAGPLVKISGEVKRPAIYELTGSELIAEAIELAGGHKPEAFLESVSLDRVGPNDSRVLVDINLADKDSLLLNNTPLQDGDKITVHSIYDFHENRVYLGGHVKHPGLFGINDTMRISHLIDNGDQLKENAYMARADLFRTQSDGTKTLISVNLEKVLNNDKDSDIQLEPFDSLVIYSFKHVTRIKYVDIKGEVKNPGKYVLYNNTKLSDIIFLAGNLTKQAYMLQCEIARVNPGHPPDIIMANLEDIFINNVQDADIAIKEDDCIFIRQIPNWKPVQIVTIEGEIRFPGKYAIQRKKEKLSDLIKRAGGLTPTAFTEGTLFYRKSIEAEISRRNIGQIINSTQEVHLDSLGNTITDTRVLFDPKQLNRIIIDLSELYKKPGSPSDIVLADADYIYIPTIPSGVQVVGAIAANGTITFEKGKKAKHFISLAGGLTPDGDESALRLVKPNGKVYYGRKARNRKIELGDVIIVPSKIKQKTNWGKIISTTATVIGSMATTIFVVDRLR